MKIFGQLKSALLESFTEAGKPAAGKAGRIIWESDTETVKVDDGAAWTEIGGGGGGGGSIVWHADNTTAAIAATEFDHPVYLFQDGDINRLTTVIKVPSSYAGGIQIRMKIGFYSPSSSGTVLFTTNSTLIRRDTDAINSATNVHASTNAAVTNTVAYQFRAESLDLTDASGLVNGVAVSAGDILLVTVLRDTQNDTDTDTARFLPTATEVIFS